MSDRYTQTQFTHAKHILGSSLFSETERRRFLLDLTAMSRFEARNAIQALAVEHGRRQGQQRDIGDAA